MDPGGPLRFSSTMDIYYKAPMIPLAKVKGRSSDLHGRMFEVRRGENEDEYNYGLISGTLARQSKEYRSGISLPYGSAHKASNMNHEFLMVYDGDLVGVSKSSSSS